MRLFVAVLLLTKAFRTLALAQSGEREKKLRLLLRVTSTLANRMPTFLAITYR